ncbi:hypothetical protein [Desertivirga arenae]|uniref:hypothetical protein n=1 Tax=Desertivirga arenae TaxID=2810309 RepID=UPI001A97931A|nr:hypothetical protein [Pedobacter sp. SYSU D00823]
MSVNAYEDQEQGSASSNQPSGIEGNPESKEGKVSYGGTSEEEHEQQKKENEGFPAGSYNESSEGGENNILDEEAP